MLKTRISLPKTARQGELIEVKTLVSHPMHTGFQVDNMGRTIERNILTEFTCEYLGEVVFRARFYPSVAANPYLSFFFKATESGDVRFIWKDQHDQVTQVLKSLVVEYD